jgi:hypothetical protein
LAFLDYKDDPEIIYRTIRDQNYLPEVYEAEKKRVMSMIACNGLVPGLEVNEWFTWPVVDNYVVVTSLLPPNMPADVRIEPTDTSRWWIPKQDLFSYLYKLGHQKEMPKHYRDSPLNYPDR